MEILNNFGIQPVLLLAQIVNFLIILFLLKKFFYKPIGKVLQDRKKRIEQSLINADLIEEKLKKTQEQQAQILEAARTSAKTLITDAHKEAQRIADTANLDARQTAEETVKKAALEIERQRVQMQKQLEDETLTLVVQVVKKVLGRTLKSKEKEQLTAESLSEIKRQVH